VKESENEKEKEERCSGEGVKKKEGSSSFSLVAARDNCTHSSSFLICPFLFYSQKSAVEEERKARLDKLQRDRDALAARKAKLQAEREVRSRLG
jgi:hypothetical protein